MVKLKEHIIRIAIPIFVSVMLTGCYLIYSTVEEVQQITDWEQVCNNTENVIEEDDAEDFIGVWEFKHGYRLNMPGGRLRQIEFLADGSLLVDGWEIGIHGRFSWEWNGNDQLYIEWQSGILMNTIEIDGDILRIINEDDNAGIWRRENSSLEMDQDWIIADYLNLFELEEGNRIVDNTVILGDQLDIIIYDIESTIYSDERGVKDWYFIVIVKRDEEVLDVIRHEEASQLINIYNLVIEYDFNFDGENDIVFLRSCQPGRVFLNLENRLWEIENFPCRYSARFDTINVYFYDERQLILIRTLFGNGSHGSWTRWYLYSFNVNELVLVEQLSLTTIYQHRRIWEEGRFVDGQWQESALSFQNARTPFDGLWEYGEFCYGYLCRRDGGEYEYWDGGYDVVLYERIFGADAHWDLRRNARPFNSREEQ